MAEKNDYVNRELSWIEFNYRVLSEARDKSTPLFDRLKFLSITASNLDEFYMVRVASLKDMVHAKYAKKDIAGLTAKEQLDKISEKTHQLVDLQYSTYNRSLVPALKQNGLRIVMEHEDLTEDEAAFADEYFHKNVYPVLTPMAFDSSRPFPLIRNKTLNIAALLKKKNEKEAELEFAMVQVPSVIPRIVELPEEKDENGETQRVVILLEEIIERNMQSLFLNYDIVASHPFRIMRNADFSLDEEEAVDLLEEIQKQLKKRQWGEAIRLEIESNVDKQLLKILKKELSISSEDIFQISGPLDLTFLMKMYGLDGFDHLKTPKYTPQPVPELMNEDNIFTNIRKGDILLHHPYQSFDPVVNFVRSAARDPEVLAIKQTLYRVSGNSPIIAALAEAADNGKQVSVLVELKEILAYVKTASIPRQRLLEEDKKLEMLEKESQRILNIKVKLYDSFAEEILDRTEFETFKAKYDQSLEEIRQAMECQQREIRNLQETLEKQQEWLEYFLEYRDRTEVDRLMLVNLVKRIEVYEQKRIIIHFWFEDEFEKVLGLLETVNRAKPDQRVEAFLKGKGAEASA